MKTVSFWAAARQPLNVWRHLHALAQEVSTMKTKMACHLKNISLLCPVEGFVIQGSLTILDGFISALGGGAKPGRDRD